MLLHFALLRMVCPFVPQSWPILAGIVYICGTVASEGGNGMLQKEDEGSRGLPDDTLQLLQGMLTRSSDGAVGDATRHAAELDSRHLGIQQVKHRICMSPLMLICSRSESDCCKREEIESVCETLTIASC